MATLTRIAGRRLQWKVDVRVGPKRFRKFFGSRVEAAAFKRECELRPIDDITGYRDRVTVSIVEAITRYYENHSKFKLKRTASQEGKWFEELCGFLEGRGLTNLNDVTRTDVEEFQSHLRGRLKNASINRRFNTLKHFFRMCEERDLLLKNPAAKIRRLPEDSVSRRIWSDAQIVQLLNAAAPWASDCFAMLSFTGARASSVANLKWADVDFVNMLIYFKSRKGVGGQLKTYQFPIMEPIHLLLLSVQQKNPQGDYVFLNSSGNPVTATHLSREARRLIGKLGFVELKLHGLRHTVLTRSATAGGVDMARMIAGHSNIKTTQGYLHPERSEMEDTLRKVLPFYKRPAP